MLQHSYHADYVDESLPKDVVKFIDTRDDTATPAVIYRDLMASTTPGKDRVLECPVY